MKYCHESTSYFEQWKGTPCKLAESPVLSHRAFPTRPKIPSARPVFVRLRSSPVRPATASISWCSGRSVEGAGVVPVPAPHPTRDALLSLFGVPTQKVLVKPQNHLISMTVCFYQKNIRSSIFWLKQHTSCYIYILYNITHYLKQECCADSCEGNPKFEGPTMVNPYNQFQWTRFLPGGGMEEVDSRLFEVSGWIYLL